MSPRFARSETRERALHYLRGLVSSDGRRNGWTLADQAGEQRPDGMQRLLTTAAWDEERVREDVADFVRARLAARGSALVVLATGFVKKGANSAGVERQFSPESRRVENCQVGIFVLHSAPGRAPVAVDRRLYLPPSWAVDVARRRRAGVPAGLLYQSGPELARSLLARTLGRAPSARWVICPEPAYAGAALRDDLHRDGRPYALGVSVTLAPPGGRGPVLGGPEQVAAALPETAWRRGVEAGVRWACVPRYGAETEPATWLLLVRTGGRRGELRALECLPPPGADPGWQREVLGHLAAARSFHRSARELVGLDHYEVRSWRGWHRHVTLASAAHACVLAAARSAPVPMALPA